MKDDPRTTVRTIAWIITAAPFAGIVFYALGRIGLAFAPYVWRDMQGDARSRAREADAVKRRAS